MNLLEAFWSPSYAEPSSVGSDELRERFAALPVHSRDFDYYNSDSRGPNPFQRAAIEAEQFAVWEAFTADPAVRSHPLYERKNDQVMEGVITPSEGFAALVC